MQAKFNDSNEQTRPRVRQPYTKPEVRRVDLALEETLSAGCKLDGSSCTDFPGTSAGGS